MSLVQPIALSRSPRRRRLLIRASALLLVTATAFLLFAWYEGSEATKPVVSPELRSAFKAQQPTRP
jgi:hypothetical protein